MHSSTEKLCYDAAKDMFDLERASLQLEREKLNLEVDRLGFEKSKYDSEAETRELDKLKNQADAAKARAEAYKTLLEAQEMTGTPLKRPAWITPATQGVAVIIAVAGTLFSFALNREIAQKESAAANSQLQASKAQLESAQANLDKAKSELEAKEAQDQKQQALDQKVLANQQTQDAKTSLAKIQSKIVADNEELNRIRKLRDEASLEAAVAPARSILENIQNRSSLTEDDQKRLSALLTSADRTKADRVTSFLTKIADNPNIPVTERLAAQRALIQHAMTSSPANSTEIAALKKAFISIGTSRAGEEPFDAKKWYAMEDFLGAETIGPFLCDEYDDYAKRKPLFNMDKLLMTYEIARVAGLQPRCSNALWDYLDPRMDTVRASSTAGWAIPREMLLARYIQTGNPRGGFNMQLEVKGKTVPIRWNEPYYEAVNSPSYNTPEQANLLHITPWFEPASHNISWQEGEDFNRALEKWPDEHRRLTEVLSEEGLPHLRACNVRILQMLVLFDTYVSERDIQENCPAGTLN